MRTINKINPFLDNIGEDVMGFLNEIQLKHPEAVSFASGRPDERYFGIAALYDHFMEYVHAAGLSGAQDTVQVLNNLGQYNRAKGIVNEEVARFLQKDEGISVHADDILITVGTQEALAIAVITLCDREQDVIIVEDPTYIGISHFSKIGGYEVDAVPVYDSGISLPLLEQQVIMHQAKGRNVKMVYVIPDYQNPTGNTMPLENRLQLLELADRYDFLILEDNAYGEFSYDADSIPTLKSLDKEKRVIYLRSFSKTLYPSLRLSAMVADQVVTINGIPTPLSGLMAKVKGYITVNTPSVTQAVLGGILLKNDHSLKAANREKIAALKQKRDTVLSALNDCLDARKFPWARDVSWNIPKGGFFITLNLPFKTGREEVMYCVEKYKLIFTPMSFFYLNAGGDHQIRLAFSQLPETAIRTGIERLSQYLKEMISIHQSSFPWKTEMA